MTRPAFRVLHALFVVVLSAGGSFVLPSTSAAQTTREPPPEALEFFASGRAHYEAGRYPEAAQDLEAALQLDPGSPTLIYNLSRVYELMGELDRAIRFNEQYLTLLSPDDVAERETAESSLRRLRGARDWLELRRAAEQGQVQSLRQLAPRVIVHERGVADLPFWITLGSGAALLAAGGATGGFAFKLKGDTNAFVLRMPSDQGRREELADRTRRLALTTDILLGVGIATCLGATLLYLLRVRTFERDAEEGEQATAGFDVGTVDVGSDGQTTWLTWRGRW
ncbi:MAG: tetratricopeptide repeat protein [Sandaracinus sp.]|nr:tetratricopeptide repeat protein [Sandaracinus sp.]MCB9611439.1 tetratricopeptide repeat protein [Sandaracinus sp.]